jgi:hypothetical protein
MLAFVLLDTVAYTVLFEHTLFDNASLSVTRRDTQRPPVKYLFIL